MGKDLFDLDDSLVEKKDHQEELKKANILCIREQYDRALDIYNKILDEDMECEGAYVGLLKAHSECFTKFEGEQIEKDIRVIERMFPDIEDEEYISYLKKRKEFKTPQKPAPAPITSSSYKKEETSTRPQSEKVAKTEFKEIDFYFKEIDFFEARYESWNLEQKGFDKEHESYFLSVMNNPDVPIKLRVKAAEHCGEIAQLHGRLTDALPRYEFAIDNILFNDKDEDGKVFYLIGCIYHYGTQDKRIPKNDAKTKQYWLRGRDEYDNESCKDMLRISFGL